MSLLESSSSGKKGEALLTPRLFREKKAKELLCIFSKRCDHTRLPPFRALEKASFGVFFFIYHLNYAKNESNILMEALLAAS